MPNYMGKKQGTPSETYGDYHKIGYQTYKVSNKQATFAMNEAPLQSVGPKHPIGTKVTKQVAAGLDQFGYRKSSARPIRTTGGKI